MTTPSGDPVPSKKPQDLQFNAELLDKLVNGTNEQETDRLGNDRLTWAGVVALISGTLGIVGKATKADLDADLAWRAGTVGWVLNDSTAANNVVYRKTGGPGAGAWVAASDSLLSYLQGMLASLVDFDGGDTTDYLLTVVDSARRRLAAWRSDGTLLAKLGIGLGVANGMTWTANADGTYTLSLGTEQGELPVGSSSVLRGEYDNSDYLWALIDSAGRRLLTIYNDGTVEGKFASAEVVTARGSRSTLGDRLSQYLDAYGLPRRHTFNEHRLRRWRYLRRKRLLAESAQIVVALIGDSYTHNTTRYSGALADTLVAELGDAGGGWVGFASNAGSINGNVRPSSYVFTRPVGTWGEGASANYYTIPSPDTGQAVSSTAGDSIRVTGPASPTLSVVKFYWNGTADGVMRYRWNGGSWTTINVQGSGIQTANLAGLPGSGSWTLDLEVVSGTCKPCGIDVQSAASGVRIHKLGGTGTQAAQWAAVDATQWQASIAALAPQLVTVMHGTNDQFAGRTPAQFAADLTTIVSRVRAAVPGVDVAILMPAENQSGNAVKMKDYAAAAAQVAAAQGCAYLDTQYLFGDPDAPTEYGSAGAIPLYSSDNVHPEPATGGRVICDGVLRLLQSAT